MSTEITRHSTNTALTIAEDQTGFTDQQIAALRQIGLGANTQADVEVFFHQAKRSGLDPFRREIYMITRKTKNGPKATIQTGIDGFYKIADRVTRATGGTWGIPETLWCGPNGQWRDVWLEETPPAAAKVTVERNGSRFTTVATSAEYNAGSPMWQKMPARMIAKCAEALAIRRAFPDDLSGLYTSEEMAQADNQAPAPRPQAQPSQGGSRHRRHLGNPGDPVVRAERPVARCVAGGDPSGGGEGDRGAQRVPVHDGRDFCRVQRGVADVAEDAGPDDREVRGGVGDPACVPG